MAKKSKDFQLEIRLGLTLIVLVLVILNIAAHYTLFRVRNSLETQIREQLTEAAVVTATRIDSLSAEVAGRIRRDYALENLAVFHLSYDRVIGIHENRPLDSELLKFDSTLTAEELNPVLMNMPVFRHKSGQQNSMIFYPARHAGSKYLISVVTRNALLSSLENAGRILIFVGLFGILIIIFASLQLVRIVVYPFMRLKDKAEKSGHLDRSAGDEVSQLISSYEKIIDSLKEKEKELTRLNAIISRKADNLEVYNNYILKSIMTGIITLDIKKCITTVNRAAVRILDLNNSELQGADFQTSFRRYPQLLSLTKQFFSGEKAINSRIVRATTRQNGALILSVSISTLTDSRGNNIGTSIIVNDQTEYIRLQEELEQGRRLAVLGEMSGGLAHQLRNSIAAIVGFARLIGRKLGGDNKIKRTIDHLLKESVEAEELVTRFLDFARPLEIEMTEFKIHELLDEIITLAKGKYTGVEFEISSGRTCSILASGDSLLLKQAIGNIVDNACKALEGQRGTVRIEVDVENQELQIQVTDNGPGIPDNLRDKIFTPFFSGSPTGHGMGLPLARKIISLHAGHLDFESTVGRGTTFTITLPSVKAKIKDRKTSAQPTFVS